MTAAGHWESTARVRGEEAKGDLHPGGVAPTPFPARVSIRGDQASTVHSRCHHLPGMSEKTSVGHRAVCPHL